MSGPTARRRVRGADPDGFVAGDLSGHENEHVRAARIVAESNARIAAAIEAHGKALEAAVDKIEPGVNAVTALATAQSLLCAWLKGWKPWRGVLVFLILARTVNASPDDVPRLVGALSALLKAVSGGAL